MLTPCIWARILCPACAAMWDVAVTDPAELPGTEGCRDCGTRSLIIYAAVGHGRTTQTLPFFGRILRSTFSPLELKAATHGDEPMGFRKRARANARKAGIMRHARRKEARA